MRDFLVQTRKLAYDEVEKTGMPVKFHVDLAREVGKKLAKKLRANVNIVEAGTLLMDCLIGQAIRAGKLEEHIAMSLAKANKILDQSIVSNEVKENIRHCISEHHGTQKFYSLESEICCNADCYRFVSIKGFSYAMRYIRSMPFSDLVTLLDKKVTEKWGLLSLSICKKELANQHEIIEKILRGLKAP